MLHLFKHHIKGLEGRRLPEPLPAGLLSSLYCIPLRVTGADNPFTTLLEMHSALAQCSGRVSPPFPPPPSLPPFMFFFYLLCYGLVEREGKRRGGGWLVAFVTWRGWWA